MADVPFSLEANGQMGVRVRGEGVKNAQADGEVLEVRNWGERLVFLMRPSLRGSLLSE